MRCWRFNSSII